MAILHQLVYLVAIELSSREGFRKSGLSFCRGKMVRRPTLVLSMVQWQNGRSMAAVKD